MEIITAVEAMKTRSREWRSKGKTIVLVPTMGYFHEGHLSLIREGRRQGDILVVSLFVNPTQFAPSEDFDAYPRDFERDRRLAEQIGVDVIFYPDNNEMYPSEYKTYIEVSDLGRKLCGATRPTFFRGVTTVVLKLFTIVQPHVALFGWKDAQQFIIIQRMVEDFNLDVQLIGMPIVREPDGLAMSSRNAYLNPQERKEATVLYSALQKAQSLIGEGVTEASQLRREMETIVRSASSARIDYIDIVSLHDLQRLDHVKHGKTLIALAVFIGNTRLIDNIRV